MAPDFFAQSLAGCELTILALDPGETTGVALFKGSQPISFQQIKGPTLHMCFMQIRDLICTTKPDVIVMEDYKVYAWKTKDHAWASLFTPRLIGAIECFCADLKYPLVKQMAQQGKSFVTDDKLHTWNVWPEGRHSRDACRHAIHYLLFEVAKVHNPTTKKGSTA